MRRFLLNVKSIENAVVYKIFCMLEWTFTIVITKHYQLMLYIEIKTVCSENYIKA